MACSTDDQQANYFCSMTSVLLMIAVTVSPAFRSISSALRRVMTLAGVLLAAWQAALLYASPAEATALPGLWRIRHAGGMQVGAQLRRDIQRPAGQPPADLWWRALLAEGQRLDR